jgi:hypothetical protein
VTYDASKTLVLSAIVGTTLYELASDNFPESKDEALGGQFAKALKVLTSYGIEYFDEKLDNFLMLEDGRVTIVDLEHVRFNKSKAWEESSHRASLGSLMREFKRIREPNRQLDASVYFPSRRKAQSSTDCTG